MGTLFHPPHYYCGIWTLSILLDVHFAHSKTMSPTCENAVLSNEYLSLTDSLETHEGIYVSLNSFSPFKSRGMDEISPIVIQKVYITS